MSDIKEAVRQKYIEAKHMRRTIPHRNTAARVPPQQFSLKESDSAFIVSNAIRSSSVTCTKSTIR